MSTEDRAAHFSGNVAQKAIIEKDGKILVCRGIGDSVWEFPGGRLHDGEAPLEGIKREVREELGIELTDVMPSSVLPSYHAKSDKHQVFIVYACSCEDKELTVDMAELEEVRWISKDELRALPMFEDCEAAKREFLKK